MQTFSDAKGLESGSDLMAAVPLCCFPCLVLNLTQQNLYLFLCRDATLFSRPLGVYAVERMACVTRYSEVTLHAWKQVGGLGMEYVCGVLEVLVGSESPPSGNAAENWEYTSQVKAGVIGRREVRWPFRGVCVKVLSDGT